MFSFKKESKIADNEFYMVSSLRRKMALVYCFAGEAGCRSGPLEHTPINLEGSKESCKSMSSVISTLN